MCLFKEVIVLGPSMHRYSNVIMSVLIMLYSSNSTYLRGFFFTLIGLFIHFPLVDWDGL